MTWCLVPPSQSMSALETIDSRDVAIRAGRDCRRQVGGVDLIDGWEAV